MLKLDAKNKIISGFILMAVFLLFIGGLGWYSVEKIDNIENVVITGYQIKTGILECRRQEKNILIRGITEENLVSWQKAFAESLKIIDMAWRKNRISPGQKAILTNALIEYKKEFDAFINMLEKDSSWLTSPASTKYHLNKEGGLLEHSVGVTETLLKLRETLAPQISEESCVIVGLLHDVGKIGMPGKP